MALTAASTPIPEPAKTFKNSALGKSTEKDWQRDAWQYLRDVGELRYHVEWLASSVSRCRIIAADVDDNGDPTGPTENASVAAMVRDIGGGLGGQTQLLKRQSVFLTVPGEGYLAMVVRNAAEEGLLDTSVIGQEQWLALSREEIVRDSRDRVILSMPDGAKHEYDPDVDMLFRVWNQDPRNASDADSPVRSAMAALNEIAVTTRRIENAAKSRAVGNGVLFLPEEMSLPNTRPTGDDTGTPAPRSATADDLQDLIFDVATTAVKDENSMAAYVPVMAQVPGEWADKIKHVTWDSEVSSTALTTRDSAIRRLAMSLNTSPERLLGLGSNSNHWSAWVIDETDVKVHIAPVIETICTALTRSVLRPALERAGLDPDKFAVWYDSTPLTQDPDRKDEARDAFDRGALTAQEYRLALGFDEDGGYDLASTDGWKRLAADRVAQDITLAPMLAGLLAPDAGVIEAQALPAQTPPAPAVEDGTGRSEPEDPTGEAAAARAMLELCVTRALTLANKRRRSRSDRAVLGDTPLHQAHVLLGPVGVEEAREHLAGWTDEVPERVLRMAGLNPDAAVPLVQNTALVALHRAADPVLTDDMVREVMA